MTTGLIVQLGQSSTIKPGQGSESAGKAGAPFDQAGLVPIVRRRRCRQPFYPSQYCGGAYRLPLAISDDLGHRLQGRRNAAAAYTLGVYLARNHAGSTRLVEGFAVDRRGIVLRGDLSLTEDQIRGALKALEAIGYLDRDEPVGNGRRRSSKGVRMAAIRFRFGSDFMPEFLRAKAHRRRATKSPRNTDFVRREVDQGDLRKSRSVAVPTSSAKAAGRRAFGQEGRTKVDPQIRASVRAQRVADVKTEHLLKLGCTKEQFDAIPDAPPRPETQFLRGLLR